MSHDGAKKNVKGGVWVTYVVEMVRINRIRRFVMQPRTYFDPDEITARAGSMKAVGQQAAIVVERVCGDPTHDFEIIDGESRWLSAREAGIEEVLCIIRSVPYASPVEKHLASLVANCNRSQHTPMDFSNALQLQVREGMSQAELARATGEQPMRISLYLSLQDLHPDIQPLLEPTTPKKGRLSPAVGFSLARVPRDKQLEALALARRPDGRVVKSKVDAVVATMLGHKKSRIRIGRAKRRASIEHALRSIGLGAQKVLSVSTGEAQEIFGELKKGGELEGIDSLEDLLAGLRQMKTGLEAEGPVFEGLPKLKKQATPEEVAEHEMRLHEYWLKRAGPGSGDRLLLALAYPKRRDWKPWVPARNIFPGWESNARPPKTGFTPKAGK